MSENRLGNLWVERFRPKNLDELCIDPKIKKMVESWGDNIPHLLLTSTPGTGKTTFSKILVNNILNCDYLYINASDENGVDVVRNKISGFIQTKSLDGNLKVVILDEVDQFSISAQSILRNMMESYAENARFILTGNHKHRISKALQSRCQPLEIMATMKQAFKRCIDILKLENIQVSKEQQKLLANLVKTNFPDIRKCIGEMQKNCIGGILDITEKNNTNVIIEIIMDNINDKQSMLTRKHLIDNEELFNSDWDQLLVDLLNHIYKMKMDIDRKRTMILTIADHLEKSSRVNDKEINFFACILNLENL